MKLNLLLLVTCLTYVSALPTNLWENLDASEDGLSEDGSSELSQDELPELSHNELLDLLQDEPEDEPEEYNEPPVAELPASHFEETSDEGESPELLQVEYEDETEDYNEVPVAELPASHFQENSDESQDNNDYNEVPVAELPASHFQENSDESHDDVGLSEGESPDSLQEESEEEPEEYNEVPVAELPASHFEETPDESQDNNGLSEGESPELLQDESENEPNHDNEPLVSEFQFGQNDFGIYEDSINPPEVPRNESKVEDNKSHDKEDDEVLQSAISETDYNNLPEIDSETLQALINKQGLEDRAKKLFDIAKTSVDKFGNPTRVIGSPGHTNTIKYIIEELKKLGGYYTIKTQKLNIITYNINSLSLSIGGDKPKSLRGLSATPPTPGGKPVNGNLVLVDNFGCSLKDFPSFAKDNIVLIKRGKCSFEDKSSNSGLSGAKGMIVYGTGSSDGLTLSITTGKQIPSVSTSQSDVQKYIDKLSSNPQHQFKTTLKVDSFIKNITTQNVIAETVFGDHDNVVALGAHSDSVAEGPGINDDGSGTISLLEVAKQLSKFKIKNAVRFAWFTAEEVGLIGSTYYADSLSSKENSKVRLFMDYDMIASPNFEYQIYDANNERHPDGSGNLKQVYIDWYVKHGLNFTFIPFNGRSDYRGFINNGIPAGGIFTGAEGVKNEKSKVMFGGKAGAPLDPCYHLLCDDVTNVDYPAWVINTKLIAHSVAVYAKSFQGFPERKAVVKDPSKMIGNSFITRDSMLNVLFLVTCLTFVSALPTNPWQNSEGTKDGLSQDGSPELSQDELPDLPQDEIKEENQHDQDNQTSDESQDNNIEDNKSQNIENDDVLLSVIDETDYNTLPEIDSEALQALINKQGLEDRAKKLFDIAKTSVDKFGNPTRVIGSPGHTNTIKYIIEELKKLGGYYTIKTQKLNVISHDINSVSLSIGCDKPKSLRGLSATPPTPGGKPVNGNLVLVNNFGCSLKDFPSFAKDNIVLIKRGKCSFEDKSSNSGLSGAKGMIIYGTGSSNGLTLSIPTGKQIPSVSTSQSDVQKYIDKLSSNPQHQFKTTLKVDSFIKNVTTMNVIAETVFGDHDNVVSLGAHTDSVAEGPGINDDGSGTLSLLEVAKQLSKFKINNAVRFAWFTAEEVGLFGSTYYADSLSSKENSKVRLFMDYDMIASPNFEYQIYDANNEQNPNGSGNLKQLYIDWYVKHGLNFTFIPFDGRSDYVGFINNGIPAGGIFTGAEGVKNEKSKEIFGGKAGAPLDPCYHLLCDDVTNVDYPAWVINTKLIAHSVAFYAKSFQGFPERKAVDNEPLVSEFQFGQNDFGIYEDSINPPEVPRNESKVEDNKSHGKEAISETDYNALPEIESEALQALINKQDLEDGAKKLLDIAKTSVGKFRSPTRVVGSTGHINTVKYIIEELKKLGGYYTIKTQEINVLGHDVNSFSLSIDGIQPNSSQAILITPPTPNGKPVDGNLVLVNNFGCSLNDFPSFSKDNIVLVRRGECSFEDKSSNSGLSGAKGMILYDPKGELSGMLGLPTGKEVPTVSVSEADVEGYIEKLLANPQHQFKTTLQVDSVITNVTTVNIIAETVFGDHDNVVSLGAHTDSGSKGPGISDNGSGAISLLEVAKHLSKFKTNNAVRFLWFTAEEVGLFGSTYYADSLSSKENSKVRLFMNYDMIASPNFEYGVYNGNNKDHPNGSEELKQVYVDWYTKQGLNHTFVPFNARSDYEGFLKNGIPSGGLFTGAERLKTEKSKEMFGGKAGEPLDPCYHQLCDDLNNVNYPAWIVNTKVAAHSMAVYAKSLQGFPERKAVLHSLSLVTCLALVSALPANPWQAILGASQDNIVLSQDSIKLPKLFHNEFKQGHKNHHHDDDDDDDDVLSSIIDETDYNSLPEIDTESLQALVNKHGLEHRAKKLFHFAKSSVDKYGHPTRVIGSPGHTNTIKYIAKELKKLGGYYTIKTQKFDAIDGKVNSVSLLIDGIKPKSLEALSLTPPTPDERPVHGNLVLVDNFGCSLQDFPKFAQDNIVLIKRGQCSFGDKSINSGLSGAKGAIIYDSAGSLHGTLGTPTGKEVATVSVSQADVQEYIDKLLANPEHQFETTLYVDSYIRNITTLNVVADTVFGDHDNIVALGAHSDSVAEGPGINDDGSGTISLLEVAKHLSNFKINNAVRFAWWAAEEEGLLGSTFYADNLSSKDNSKVRLFMDYDMMASPNFEYEVYDANNKDHPNGSGDLKQLYIDWYTQHGLNYTLIPFDGRSDYVGFIDNGIPAGGIATGAEGVKNEKSREKFGGKTGEWFDPCYHQLCDNLDNPDYQAWVVNTKLIAHSVAVYAKSFEGFPEREVKVESNKNGNNFIYRGSNLIM
ncbi:Aminopeptidase Y [Spathaspora sp. JA1]|nr:Aminopeptidase Y [Spathaspora sp. JA1]